MHARTHIATHAPFRTYTHTVQASEAGNKVIGAANSAADKSKGATQGLGGKAQGLADKAKNVAPDLSDLRGSADVLTGRVSSCFSSSTVNVFGTSSVEACDETGCISDALRVRCALQPS